MFTRDVIGFDLLSSISRMLKLYYIVCFNHMSMVYVRVCLIATGYRFVVF